jgi:hypothetical protein
MGRAMETGNEHNSLAGELQAKYVNINIDVGKSVLRSSEVGCIG